MYYLENDQAERIRFDDDVRGTLEEALDVYVAAGGNLDEASVADFWLPEQWLSNDPEEAYARFDEIFFDLVCSMVVFAD